MGASRAAVDAGYVPNSGKLDKLEDRCSKPLHSRRYLRCESTLGRNER